MQTEAHGGPGNLPLSSHSQTHPEGDQPTRAAPQLAEATAEGFSQAADVSIVSCFFPAPRGKHMITGRVPNLSVPVTDSKASAGHTCVQWSTSWLPPHPQAQQGSVCGRASPQGEGHRRGGQWDWGSCCLPPGAVSGWETGQRLNHLEGVGVRAPPSTHQLPVGTP